MKVKSYTYEFEPINDDWDNVLVYDVETVEDLTTLQRIKDENVYDYLNIEKAKHVAFGVKKSVYVERMTPPLNKLLKKLERRSYNDYYIYVMMNSTYEEIAYVLYEVVRTLNLNLVAHNGKRFDFLLFRDKKLKHVKGNSFMLERKRYHRFIDTFEITKTSLTDSLKQFGVIDSKNVEHNLKEYLVHDVEMLIDLTKALKEAKIQYTLTRTARRFYYDLAVRDNVKAIRTYLPYDLDLAYIGGRVEVFKAWAENVYCYDVNSLYPYVMTHFLYPKLTLNDNELKINVFKGYTKLKERFNEYIETIRPLIKEYMLTDARKLKHLYDTRKTYFYIRCKLKGIHPAFKELERTIIRYFPFSYVKSGRRVYTFNSEQTYFVEGYETLFLAFFEYEIEEIYYTESDYFYFKNEIIKLYNERKEAKKRNDIATAQRLKAILVNLYGIYGLRKQRFYEEEYSIDEYERVFELINDYTKNDIVSIKDTMYNKIVLSNNEKRTSILATNDSVIITQSERTFSSYMSAPTLATATTSHGRFWLLTNVYYVVVSLKGEVYYVDTDSLFTNVSLNESNELGAFKLEKKSDLAFFFAPKTYILVNEEQNETYVKAKGTGRNLVRTFSQQSFKTMFRVINKLALSPQRKTVKIPRQDGWLIYVSKEVNYFLMYRNVYELAMTYITDENVKSQLRRLYDEAQRKNV